MVQAGPHRTLTNCLGEAMRAQLRHLVEEGLLPGYAFTMSLAGEPVFADEYGWADHEDKRPFRTDTIYRVCSESKFFTGLAVLLLVQDGALDFEDPVEKHLPAFAGQRVCEYGKD